MKLLRIKEAADLLGVHPNTMRNFANRGMFTVYRIGLRRDRRFKRDEIESYLTRPKITIHDIDEEI